MGGGARFAMYCALDNLVSCVNDITWPSRRLMNQSIVVPTRVLICGPYKRGWYHGIHDLLQEWHRELPGRHRRFLIFLLTYACLILQIPAQFRIRSTQFFVFCPRRSQISLDAFLVCSRRSHFFLKGLHCFHNLLQGEAFAPVWCNRSLPHISHRLVFLVLAGGTMFWIGPHDGRQIFLSVDRKRLRASTTISRQRILAFTRNFLPIEHLKTQRQRVP